MNARLNQRIRVLMVEDNETEAQLVKEMLRASIQNDFTLSHVVTHQAAIDRLSNEPFDVVLLDLSLPDSQGINTFLTLHQRFPNLPFVIWTGLEDESIALSALKEGAQDYLHKVQQEPRAIVRSLHYAIERSKNELLEQERVRLATEIEERRKAIGKLRAAESMFRSLVEQSLVGILIVQDNRFPYVNPRLAEIIGYAQNDIMQTKSVNDLVAEEDHALAAWHLRKRMENPTECPRRSIRCRRSDGSVIFVEVDGKRVEYEGRPAIIVTVLDVTEGRHTQTALEDANRRLHDALSEIRETQPKLIEQERLHALSTMASGVAHDLNNALSPILGYSELLLTKPNTWDDHEKVRRYLTSVNVAAKDAANVVRRLRELYRHPVEGDDMLPVKLGQLVEETVSLTAPKWKAQSEARGIHIDVRCDVQELPDIQGNESELREALMNLIFNAVDAMPDGGSITVTAFLDQNVEAPETDSLQTDEPESQSGTPRAISRPVVLSVSDTGTGMTEDVRKKCLEPFFTTKGEYGTGLGLPMVKGIVHRHMGTLEVDSHPGVGATFSIRLPIPLKESAKAEVNELLRPARLLRVLVVDDEANVLATLAEYIQSDGHHVGQAPGGLEGLESFLAGQYDVVITDRAMPGMNGDQLALAINRLQPDMPVIMLTGFEDQLLEGKDLPPGVTLIVNKPVSLGTLRNALAKVTMN